MVPFAFADRGTGSGTATCSSRVSQMRGALEAAPWGHITVFGAHPRTLGAGGFAGRAVREQLWDSPALAVEWSWF